MAETVRLAGAANIPPGEGREIAAAGRLFAVYNVEGEFHVLDGVCPHAGGPLGQGALTGSIVTCPWHGWQFDVTTGRHCLNPNLVHPGFAARVEGEDLLVEIP